MCFTPFFFGEVAGESMRWIVRAKGNIYLCMLYCVNMSMRWDYCASQDCHRFSNKTLEKTAFSNRRQMTKNFFLQMSPPPPPPCQFIRSSPSPTHDRIQSYFKLRRRKLQTKTSKRHQRARLTWTYFCLLMRYVEIETENYTQTMKFFVFALKILCSFCSRRARLLYSENM